MDIKNLQVGIIGGGAMAENILRGIMQAGLLSEEKIFVSDIYTERLKYLNNVFNVKTTLDNRKIVSCSDVVLLAVKPQNMKLVLDEIGPVANEKKLFLSIAAGVTSAAIFKGLGGKGRIIRIMPNIAAKVLESASALCLGPSATGDDLILAKQILEAVGKAAVINEELMDAVTGLSGSGPAYFFLIIEALADAGVRAGLLRGVAQKLAAQTCLGAAKLVLESEGSPAALKDQVASPAGTTIAGLQVLEMGAVRGKIMAAVEAAVTRSKELGILTKQDKSL